MSDHVTEPYSDEGREHMSDRQPILIETTEGPRPLRTCHHCGGHAFVEQRIIYGVIEGIRVTASQQWPCGASRYTYTCETCGTHAAPAIDEDGYTRT